MSTAPASRHLGWSATSSRGVLVLALVLVLVTSSACGSADRGGGDTRSTEPATTPAATPTPPAEDGWALRCQSQVSYWFARLAEDPEHSFDYQEMGLSGLTYDALREVQSAAGGRRQSEAWLAEQSAAGLRGSGAEGRDPVPGRDGLALTPDRRRAAGHPSG